MIFDRDCDEDVSVDDRKESERKIKTSEDPGGREIYFRYTRTQVHRYDKRHAHIQGFAVGWVGG